MNIAKLLFISLLMLGLNPAVQAGDFKIFDLGLDGYEHYFRVNCQEPFKTANVIVKYEEKMSADPTVVETCLAEGSTNSQCKKNWSVRNAARTFCK